MPDMGDLDFSKLAGGDYGAGTGGVDDTAESSDDEDMPDLTASTTTETKEE
jgi:hypothetical protein